ncbi:MAG: aspartate dehydrogenase [Syntrophaceae bacterium]|nr:aspartate dehydrogenase [Syntrophaceae bacterium]
MPEKELADRTLPVGLIGLGSMGSFVAREIMKGEIPGIRLIAAADIRPPSSDLLEELQSHSIPLVQSFEGLGNYPLRLVIECANQKVVAECADFFLSQGVDLLIMSVGALVQGNLFPRLAARAEEKGCRIFLPSGAIGAVDALQAAKLRGLDEVILTTRKNPRSLGKIEGVSLEGLKEAKVVYDGPASEAVVKFPQNVNVAATLSLAGLGPEKTRVRVVADPGVDQNIHEIHARGAFGSFEIRLANWPNPDNPKTSLLSCLSVVSLLKRIQGSVQIGG